MYASGGNYRIELVDGLVRWHVWARPDVDSTEGARFAEEQTVHSATLATGAARGLVFDLSQAPSVMGPRTQGAIAATLVPWERARKPVGIVISENALQRLQWDRIVREHLAKSGRVFTTQPPAIAWAGTRRAGTGHVLGRDE